MQRFICETVDELIAPYTRFIEQYEQRVDDIRELYKEETSRPKIVFTGRRTGIDGHESSKEFDVRYVESERD